MSKFGSRAFHHVVLKSVASIDSKLNLRRLVYKPGSRPVRLYLLPPSSLFAVAMDSSTHHSFNPFYDHPPPSRQQAASSIWAPQPQLTETAWSRAIDSINRADPSAQIRPEAHRASSYPSGQSTEDIFGPMGPSPPMNKKDIGAIGDGRKKSIPDMDPMVCLFIILAYLILIPDLESMLNSSCGRSISTHQLRLYLSHLTAQTMPLLPPMFLPFLLRLRF